MIAFVGHFGHTSGRLSDGRGIDRTHIITVLCDHCLEEQVVFGHIVFGLSLLSFGVRPQVVSSGRTSGRSVGLSLGHG